MDQLQAKANYSRICQLLVGKGGDALRVRFHVKHPPSNLAAVFNSQISVLKKLQHRGVINPSQWDLLFPASGRPDSNKFDITLLTILLRNICGLSAPTKGWNDRPPTGDTSISADIVRIKIFRNQVYAHIASPQLDDTTFETLWQEISKPLVNLGIPQQDIDEAKVAPLSPEEEFYIEKLKQWKELEDDISNLMAKFNFTGKIERLCNKFQRGTRKWFFDKLSSWFDDEQSRVMILTAAPGVGKSVLSAKACELYKERGQLAACHFCDFTISDSRNPHRILQSLASQMCDNIEGFCDKLTEVFRREHSRDSLPDAYRVLLNEPLHAFDRHKPVLIVVDALDESKTESKSDFLELISEEFLELPRWVKILITSRPELQLRKKLEHFNPVEILPDDCHHIRDLEHFFQQCLPNLSEGTVNSLISKCEGSFLYAYYLANELLKRDLGIEPNLDEILPKGISGFYEKQFKRLKNGLLKVIPDTALSILKSFVNIVAASKDPLPIKILFTGMGLSNQDYQVREIIITIMSEILPLYEDCLTVYHKSLWDWLRLNGRGYEEHAFVANVRAGVHCLWLACKSVYKDIDSLSSTSHFQVTPEKMFALQNGGQYLLDVGDADDFHWLVHIRLNFLKLMYFGDLNDDISHMLRFYKSKRPNCHHWKIIHLEFFSKTIRPQRIHSFLSRSMRDKDKKLLFYLHSLANGYFDFMQRSDRGKNEARDILNESKEMWLEQIGNEYIPKNKVISHAILGVNEGEWVINDGMALSSDKKLLAYKNEWYFEVLNLPSFKLDFDLEMREEVRNRGYSGFLLFSPDSSYLLWNSLRLCISLRERKEVPFIPHGPNDIDCCSFSSCGKKMVSFEKNLVKMWDLRKKTVLVQAEIESEVNVELCLWSDCNSYILVWHSERVRPFGFKHFGVLKATSFEWLNINDIECGDSCLNDEDDYQIVYPSRCGILSHNAAEFQIRHFHLPSSGILPIANRFCSKPFMWKDKKCVIFFIFSRIAVVYDCINKEVVEKFCINCLPGDSSVADITHLEGTNFFVALHPNHAFVLSLENSIGSSVDHIQFFNDSKIKCCALSPDNLYVACCYKNCVLSIQRVDDGKTLQMTLLKKPPKACWWSNSYLWVVCTDFVVKYTFDSAEVSENALEDCSLSFKKVLRFMEGVLVLCLNNDKTAIYKICNQKLCSQEIPDSNFPASSAAISRDGLAVLLNCKSPFLYQLLEITCANKWELSTEGSILYFYSGWIWFCLTGGKDSRSSIWVTSTTFDGNFSIGSIDFPKGTKSEFKSIEPRYHVDRGCSINVVVEGTFPYTDILIILRYDWIYFIKVSNGSIVTSLYIGDLGCVGNVSSFYIPSKRMLVFVSSSEVKFLKIHNIESHLLCLEKD